MNETIQLLIPSCEGSFQSRIDDLALQIQAGMTGGWGDAEKHLLWTKAFFSDLANQLDEFRNHSLYKETLCYGAFSYVEQPPLCGCKVAILVAFTPHDELQKEGSAEKMSVSCEGQRYLFQSVRLSDFAAAGRVAKKQTQVCFSHHIAWLRDLRLSMLNNCMRTWLYVRDIDRNYAGVAVGRNHLFDKENLTRETHFIASTGIGGNAQNGESVIGIDFFSVADPVGEVKYLHAPEYLNPTYEYGISFERGTSLTIGSVQRIFISGTASIDKTGRCINQGDVLKQADRLLLNIEQLLKDVGATLGDLEYLLVYLRDPSDYPIVEKYMSNRFPNLPFLVVLAPVCRPQWLIECECLAKKIK